VNLTEERETVAMRAPDPLDAYAGMALRRLGPGQQGSGYADTLPSAWHPDDVFRGAMDRAVTYRAADRAERHRARTLIAIKRLLFLVAAGVFMLTAATGTGAWFMSQAGHAPAVVRLAPGRAACAMVLVRC